jgi:Excreted virulence factor EspC, type VII ESX diderm
MSAELRVLVAYLDELAAKQGEAAAVIASATGAVCGAAASVTSTHGPISSATAAAVDSVQDARRRVGERVERETRNMQQRLTLSARRYEFTDLAVDGGISGELRPK